MKRSPMKAKLFEKNPEQFWPTYATTNNNRYSLIDARFMPNYLSPQMKDRPKVQPRYPSPGASLFIIKFIIGNLRVIIAIYVKPLADSIFGRGFHISQRHAALYLVYLNRSMKCSVTQTAT